METSSIIDVSKWGDKVLSVLLLDRTTGKNIIWATDDYENLGKEYNSHSPILFNLITGDNSNIIQPRVLKTKEKQGNRTKAKAEVFTPSWVCNAQNNLVDEAWFKKKAIFNIEIEKGRTWKATKNKIEFPKNRTWQEYVDEQRLEITCGEAPYLASRYDAVSGGPIEIYRRIGMLDRKMRIINENTFTEDEWFEWSKRAFMSIYGFEFQGDSLLIARENLLASYQEYMKDRFNREPNEKELLEIATIISWNLWQMDGLTFTIPFQKPSEKNEQMTLFDSQEEEKNVFCIIKDWIENENVVFQDLVNEGKNK